MRFRRAATSVITRVFFATDLHGSNRCFAKFVNAASAYKADVLILGGDVAGKQVVPVIAVANGTYTATFDGAVRRLTSARELAEFERMVSDVGMYSWKTTQDEAMRLEGDSELVEETFRGLALERLRGWVALAEQRLGGSGVRVFVNCGNDDPFVLDEVISSSAVIVFPEGRVVDLDDRRVMASVGFANITPWRCPRDVSEEELAICIDRALDGWTAGAKELVLNLHCPPFDSGLDIASQLSTDLGVETIAGRPVLVPVGSTAVRDAIHKYRPLLSLHGHIHESRGVARIGPTLAINPGSEYSSGILRGALIDFDRQGVASYVLTCG